jgi:hypothetical protein
VAGFSTMTWAPASNESMASPKWEVGGVVTWTTSGRAFSSIGPVVGEPGPDAVPLGGSLRRGGRAVADGGQRDARRGLQAAEVLPGNLPGSNQRCLHESTFRIRR